MRGRERNNYEKYGDVYFVTFTVVGFIHLFDHIDCIYIMMENLRFYQTRGDFTILAFVIMPNHVHLVIRVAEGRTISKCIGNLKRMTSRQISLNLVRTSMTELLAKLQEAALKEPADDCRIWKPRFDCFTLNNIKTIRQKIQYIHGNPVRAGLVIRDIDWPYSSALSYTGFPNTIIPIDSDWCCLGFDKLRSGKGS